MSISQPAEPLLRTGPDAASVSPPAPVHAGTLGDSIALSVESDLDRVAVLWRAFESEADCTAFQTFAWQSAWQRHVGARNHVVPAIVVGRRSDGGVLFVFPLAVEGGRTRRLTWLASDLCDYNGPLLARDFSKFVDSRRFVALWGEIGRMLRSSPELRHDAVVLEKMPETVGAQRNPFLGLGVRLNASGASLVHLGGDWESFYEAQRSSATRRRDRTKLKRLGELGTVRFVTAGDPEERRANSQCAFPPEIAGLDARGRR